jgi:hypothetical protein
MKLNEIYKAAGLTSAEVTQMPDYISDKLEFYGSPAYDKLYEYFAFETGEMPYGTAKARDGDPDCWIVEQLEVIGEAS